MGSHKTQDTLFLLGGALLGAAAMYMLDPESGEARRRRAAKAANQAWETAGETVNQGWGQLRDAASDVSDSISDRISSYRSRASDAMDDASDYGSAAAKRARRLASSLGGRASDLMDRASDYSSRYGDTASSWGDTARRLIAKAYGGAQDVADSASDYADSSTLRDRGSHLIDRARDWGSHAADAAMSYLPYFSKRARSTARSAQKFAKNSARRIQHIGEPEGFGATSVVGTALTCCVIGATTMYFFDPERGPQRRAECEEGISNFVRHTGKAMLATGQGLRQWFGGMSGRAKQAMSRASETAEDLTNRVKSEIAHLLTHSRLVNVVAECDGCVTLAGPVERTQVDRLLAGVAKVPGVCQIINRLDIREQMDSSDSTQFRQSPAQTSQW